MCAFSAWMIILVAGCETTPTTPPPPPLTTTMRANLPVFDPLPQTPSLQKKGGVSIAAVPVTYEVTNDRKVDIREVDRYVSRIYVIGAPPMEQPVRDIERTTTPTLRVTPERLRFRLTLHNQLDRVFRGQGMIVQFNVAGRVVDVPAQSYNDLLAAVVPPRGQATVEISGPLLSSIPDGSTIGLMFYDVPTQVDAAGSITERQNWEWYFNYTLKPEERMGTVLIERLTEPLGPAQPIRK